MKYNPERTQGFESDTTQCPTCGLLVSRMIAKCPQDGTFLLDGPMGAFAERYEFLEALGKGGMSVIYKARQRALNRIVAIKMMHEHMMHEQAIRRFQQEGQAASSLDHPNIVKVHDFGLTDRGQPYMVMDLVEGKSLSAVIEELGELPISQCLIIFIDICEALSHAHEKGILHRDLKPSNIMLTTTSERPTLAKLVDFGIAKIMDEEGGSPSIKLTQTGELFGSPPYMSPEQCYGKKVDRRSDIYSLGCLMFECLTGQTPFEGETLVETLSKQMTAKAPLLHEVRPDKKYPSQLEDVIDKCLAKSPDGRYRNAAEVKNQLIAIQQSVDEGQQKSSGSLRQFLRFLSQWKLGALIVVAGLLILSMVAYGLTSNRYAHSEERKKLAFAKAKFIPLMRKDEVTTPILLDCLSDDTGMTDLDLEGTKITDNGMLYVNQQSDLKKLNLQATAITDQGLLALTKLSKLEELNLCETQITSAGLKNMKSMPALKVLNLRSTKIAVSALNELEPLKKLENLNLSDTGIIGPCLGPLNKFDLQVLNLSGTKLGAADLSSLKHSPPLREIALSDCQIGDAAIEQLDNLPAITNLEIHNTNLTDGCVKYLCKLRNLKTLDMSMTKITNKGLEELSRCVDLHEIHMRTNEIDENTISILKNFHDLHVLDISSCYDVDDELIKKIAELKSIDSLDLSLDWDSKKQTKLSSKAIATIAAQMPQMKELNLRNTNTIKKDSLAELIKLRNLRVLDLRDNYLERNGSHDNMNQLRAHLPNCDIKN